MSSIRLRGKFAPMILMCLLLATLAACGSDAGTTGSGVQAKLSEPNIPQIPQAK
jgi:hypothetical protein